MLTLGWKTLRNRNFTLDYTEDHTLYSIIKLQYTPTTVMTTKTRAL